MSGTTIPGASVAEPVPSAGLSQAEAAARLAARPPAPPPASRSYASIVRANTLTIFNLILAAFGVLTLMFADWRDALFLGIIVANSGIGILQEARAKRALDRLAALVAPTATVVRDGRPRTVPAGEVVEGDLMRLGAGDGVVADGRLLAASELHLDESILTGESRAVARGPGDEVRSGSFVTEGTADVRVTAAGARSYAERLVGQARSFRHPRSPLERAVNRLLLVLVGVMIPLGVLFGAVLAARDTATREAVSTSVAGIVALVPEGLILLVSVTYAAAALRMARRGALTQQLSAIESLAAVEVVCIDKTGTITAPTLRVVDTVPAPGVAAGDLDAALAAFAAAWDTRNGTLEAIARGRPGTAPDGVEGRVPFSSARRWSALRAAGRTWVLGAPERLPLGPLTATVAERAAAGRRVLALAATDAPLAGTELPPGLAPVGIVTLAEDLRQEAAAAIAFLQGEGVRVVVLSGDAPATVGAIARDVGIAASGPPLDGGALPEDEVALRDAVLAGGVVGRIAPEGKRRVVEALQAGGLHVAMLGDGVNDVPALKAAHLGIAQASGSQMTRAVADLVLVRGDFASVPPMVEEGRRILRNLQRVTKLFVTKSALAAFLILTIGLVPTSYPFLPRHLTLVSSLTIGVPAFILALAPSRGPWRQAGFLRDVAAFAVPAGVASGLGVVSGYLFALNTVGMPLVEARTVAVTALVGVGLWLVVALEGGTGWRAAGVGLLCLTMAAAYVVTILAPPLRDFFALTVPGPAAASIAAVAIAVAILGLSTVDERFRPPLGPIWRR